MRVTVVGAGAVGLNLAGRLAASGTSVRVLTRRAAVARAIARSGVVLVEAASDRRALAPIDEATTWDAAPPLGDGPVLFCVRAQETAAARDALAEAARGAVVASAQNDVDNESVLAARFERVLGVVVRQTCTLLDDRTVCAGGRGRLVVGDHPGGFGPAARSLAERFEAAGFDVGRSSRIGEDKWLKLVHNLTSAVNALVRQGDHTAAAFVEIKVRLIEEARAALDAAGLVAASCDGRDRAPEAEIAHLRESLAAGTSARGGPLRNACYAALADPGRPLEADAYHARVVALAEAHGRSAPANAVIGAAVAEAWRERLGPEGHTAADLLERIAERAAP